MVRSVLSTAGGSVVNKVAPWRKTAFLSGQEKEGDLWREWHEQRYSLPEEAGGVQEKKSNGTPVPAGNRKKHNR